MCSITDEEERLHKVWGRLDHNFDFHGNRKTPLIYNGEKDVSTFSRLFLIRFFFFFFFFFFNLQVMRTCINSGMSLNFGQIGPLTTTELAALGRLRNFPYAYNGKMLFPCLLIQFLLNHHQSWTGIKARRSFISGRIRLLTLELLALE